ncbi:beige/beach-related [Anaeramoeba flamelloides]|uniref:Beige/beach-related n=1 Tax=Anaeramoeba flamelloides TaxID=1746091 RepID=A0AAV8A1M0_9EUKA|nr:beige/beach-related [Anaeramoeba flamelloides]
MLINKNNVNKQKIHFLNYKLMKYWKRIYKDFLYNEKSVWFGNPDLILYSMDNTENSLKIKKRLKKKYIYNNKIINKNLPKFIKNNDDYNKNSYQTINNNKRNINDNQNIGININNNNNMNLNTDKRNINDKQNIGININNNLNIAMDMDMDMDRNMGPKNKLNLFECFKKLINPKNNNKIPIYQQIKDIANQYNQPFECFKYKFFQKISGELIFGEKKFHFLQYKIKMNDEDKNTKLIKCQSFKYSNIMNYKRHKYLLENKAIEIYFLTGKSRIFIFKTKQILEEFINILIEYLEPILNLEEKLKIYYHHKKKSIISNMKKKKKINQDHLKKYTKLWKNKKISNFEYLIKLNYLAGRTFNDLSQYPVFPHVIKDYANEKLDFKDPNTFRNFSNPIGCQTDKKRLLCKQKYNELKLSGLEPYHYNSHYSNYVIVIYYLFRIEPFASLIMKFSSNKFDLPDRLFDSIENIYHLGSLKSRSDVKELIPEFFYFPEFLLNINNFSLGKKQNGRMVNNVNLPIWVTSNGNDIDNGEGKENNDISNEENSNHDGGSSNNSMDTKNQNNHNQNNNIFQFIKKQTLALESKYVSEHLNEWIDLIFGYKQKGKEAVKVYNVFEPYTYMKNKDLKKIEDDTLRNGIIQSINSVGHCPKQLFSKPHPKRNSNELFQNLININNENKSNISNKGNEKIEKNEELKILINGKEIYIKPNKLKFNIYKRTGLKIQSIFFDPIKNQINIIKPFQTLLRENCNLRIQWLPNISHLLIYDIETNQILTKSSIPFNDKILCCESPGFNNLIITGGDSSILMVWKFKQYHKTLNSNNDDNDNDNDRGGDNDYDNDNNGSDENNNANDKTYSNFNYKNYKKINNLKVKKMLYGHESPIISIAVSVEYYVIVSASKEQTVIIWDLNTFKFVNLIKIKIGNIKHISISKITGDIFIYSKDKQTHNNYCYLYNVNGLLINEINLGLNNEITCSCFTFNQKNVFQNVLFLGLKSGNILVLNSYDLSIIAHLKGLNDNILTSVTCSKNMLELFSSDFNGIILKWKNYKLF